MTYSSYDQPLRITKGTTVTEFKYAPDRSRWERIDTKAGVKTITHYLGNVERIEVENSGIVEWKRYIAGAVYTVRTTATTSGSGVSYAIQRTDKSFIYNDHLGSLDVVVNSVGQVTHTASFDAWGNRRSGENWASAFVASSLSLTSYTQPITKRGYTGHEMLDDTGLIHMNGRIYDPRLARFMQADPFIQAATNTQSYNRYSYTINNPLNATDPSGFTFDLVNKHILRPLYKSIGYENSQILIGFLSAQCGFYAAYCSAYGTYNLNRAYGASPGAAMFSAGVAFLSAKMFEAAGAVANGNPVGAFFAAGFVGGVMAELQGGKFGHGFVSAGAGAAAGAQFGYSTQGFIAATIIGGTVSEMTGGKFANGAASAAFSYAAMWAVQTYGAGGSTTSSEDSYEEVVIEDSWEMPKIPKVKPATVTQAQANKMYAESPYESVPVDASTQTEVNGVLADSTFSKEASRVYRASVNNKRELGVLRVYERDGVYKVYSVGTPSTVKANALTVSPVDASLGRHVFDWHPHPWGNPQPSPVDLRTSFNLKTPGVLSYGRRNSTVYQGGCKSGMSCN